MEYKNSFLRRFLVEISVVKGSDVVKTYKSTKETVNEGKLQWKLNLFVYGNSTFIDIFLLTSK